MNVLIVDDSKYMREMVSQIIEDSSHQTFLADGHIQAMAHIRNQPIDLVLMDIEMPDVNGFELTQVIRKTIPEWLPIIFLSSNDSEEYLSKGIDAGGDDYLTKPVKEVILKAKIKAMERIVKMKHDLDEANKELEKLSHLDALTQLINRRGLEEKLEVNWINNQRLDSDMSVLMVDIDHFKKYNDTYGHVAGDECLVRVAKMIKSCFIRQTDIVARYGGEEFLVLLPFTPIDGAKFKAQQLVQLIFNANLKNEDSPISEKVSISVGVSSTQFGASSIKDLVKQADKALYCAKEQGRNQIQSFR